MKKVKLNDGTYALVDNADFELISKWKWQHFISKDKTPKHYAERVEHGKLIRMHRFLLGLRVGEKKIVDHIDSDGLNNQRKNLRFCNFSQNSTNSKKRVDCSSKFKGVSKEDSYWVARITFQGKTKRIGRFKNEREAFIAYINEAKKLFGDFCRLN